jgi:hypothetical protein
MSKSPYVEKAPSSNYIPIDDVPEHDRDDLSSYSESERPRVSDANNRSDPNALTGSTFKIT